MRIRAAACLPFFASVALWAAGCEPTPNRPGEAPGEREAAPSFEGEAGAVDAVDAVESEAAGDPAEAIEAARHAPMRARPSRPDRVPFRKGGASRAGRGDAGHVVVKFHEG